MLFHLARFGAPRQHYTLWFKLAGTTIPSGSQATPFLLWMTLLYYRIHLRQVAQSRRYACG